MEGSGEQWRGCRRDQALMLPLQRWIFGPLPASSSASCSLQAPTTATGECHPQTCPRGARRPSRAGESVLKPRSGQPGCRTRAHVRLNACAGCAAPSLRRERRIRARENLHSPLLGPTCNSRYVEYRLPSPRSCKHTVDISRRSEVVGVAIVWASLGNCRSSDGIR